MANLCYQLNLWCQIRAIYWQNPFLPVFFDVHFFKYAAHVVHDQITYSRDGKLANFLKVLVLKKHQAQEITMGSSTCIFFYSLFIFVFVFHFLMIGFRACLSCVFAMLCCFFNSFVEVSIMPRMSGRRWHRSKSFKMQFQVRHLSPNSKHARQRHLLPIKDDFWVDTNDQVVDVFLGTFICVFQLKKRAEGESFFRTRCLIPQTFIHRYAL